MERDLGSRGKVSKVLLSRDALGVPIYVWGTHGTWVSPADVVMVLQPLSSSSRAGLVIPVQYCMVHFNGILGLVQAVLHSDLPASRDRGGTSYWPCSPNLAELFDHRITE